MRPSLNSKDALHHSTVSYVPVCYLSQTVANRNIAKLKFHESTNLTYDHGVDAHANCRTNGATADAYVHKLASTKNKNGNEVRDTVNTLRNPIY